MASRTNSWLLDCERDKVTKEALDVELDDATSDESPTNAIVPWEQTLLQEIENDETETIVDNVLSSLLYPQLSSLARCVDFVYRLSGMGRIAKINRWSEVACT